MPRIVADNPLVRRGGRKETVIPENTIRFELEDGSNTFFRIRIMDDNSLEVSKMTDGLNHAIVIESNASNKVFIK